MIKGFIINVAYKEIEKKPYVALYLKDTEGKVNCLLNQFYPYFYCKKSEIDKIKKLIPANIEEVDKTNYDKEEVVKLIFNNPNDLKDASKILYNNQIMTYEADINYVQRFLIDNNLKGFVEISQDCTVFNPKEYKSLQNLNFLVDKIYIYPKLKPSKYDNEIVKKLKVFSFDIETDINASTILSLSIVCDNYKKVLVSKKGVWNNAESFNSEKELLIEFFNIIKELNPDIITGWNCIDFDLNVIKEICKKYEIDFVLGRDNSFGFLRISDNFFVESTAKAEGRLILDGISLLKNAFIKLPDYKLQTAAKYFLDESKLIKGDERADEIELLYKNDTQKLIDYNLKDSQLVIDILSKSKVLELAVMRSFLTRLTLDKIKASILALDSIYIKELNDKNVVAPTIFNTIREERIQGGYVRDSLPGLYENILVFDFKSLYPSIIMTFNIDPFSFVKESKLSELSEVEKKNLIKAPNGALFRNEEGILPNIIKDLWKERNSAKEEKNELKSYAVKILMNSFFGVLANPNCRFYSIAIANSITHFGQYLIKLTADEMIKKGFKVIYGDTDSLFISIEGLSYEESLKKGNEISKEINLFFKKFIQEKYSRESQMEIEFEKFYKKFFMPRLRGSETGAKKRYAGIIDEKLDIVGLEAVRSDWTDIAKDFQKKLLLKVFSNEDIKLFIKDFIKDLRESKFDSLLVYSKQIRKPVDTYTKTTPPHIQAARKIGRNNVGSIKYVITKQGPEEINHVSSKIDHEHYIDKQIRPIAESILDFFEEDFDEIIKDHKQHSLFDFS